MWTHYNIFQASELEIAKYKIETSLESIRTRMKIEENLINNDDSKMSTFDIFMKELNKIAEPSFRDNYYSFMEKEIIELNKIIEIKHNQLQESFKLNKVLIGKLFSADNGLKFLEERALSAVRLTLGKNLCKPILFFLVYLHMNLYIIYCVKLIKDCLKSLNNWL